MITKGALENLKRFLIYRFLSFIIEVFGFLSVGNILHVFGQKIGDFVLEFLSAILQCEKTEHKLLIKGR
jgi:hypothetical protein